MKYECNYNNETANISTGLLLRIALKPRLLGSSSFWFHRLDVECLRVSEPSWLQDILMDIFSACSRIGLMIAFNLSRNM